MQLKRIIAFAFVLACSTFQVQASRYESDECCSSWCCDYLAPCDWSIQVQGGVNPIVWTHRNDECCINGAELPSFFHTQNVPWIVGGKLGYNLSECVEVYVEGDYTQANGKHCESFTVDCSQSVNGTSSFVSKVGKYKAFGVWGGARYYFGSNYLNFCSCFIERAAFFIGMQVGFVHHHSLGVALTATNVNTGAVTGPFETTMFLKGNTISAGGNVGIDFAVNDCFSVVFTVEFLGNGAAKNCPISCLPNPLPGNNSNTISVGRYGTEIWFPITGGLKYNF